VFVRGSKTEVNGVKYVIKLRDENRKKRFHECAFCAGKKRALTTLPPEASGGQGTDTRATTGPLRQGSEGGEARLLWKAG
jgi:hypothetical protein